MPDTTPASGRRKRFCRFGHYLDKGAPGYKLTYQPPWGQLQSRAAWWLCEYHYVELDTVLSRLVPKRED